VLYRYSEVIRRGLLLADLGLVAAAWVAAFFIRFHAPGLPEPPVVQVQDFRQYALLLPVILPLWFWLFRTRGLYQPRRTRSLWNESGCVLTATAMGVVVLVAVAFFVRPYAYSRLVMGLFAVLSAGAVIAMRTGVRLALRALRRRGYNVRYLLVAGSGELAGDVIDRVHAHPQAGLRVLGVVSDEVGVRAVRGVPVVATYGELKSYLAASPRGGQRVDQVVLALPRAENDQLEKILADLDDEMVSVLLVPDLRHVLTLRSTVEDLEGLPVISLRDTPFVGMAAVRKRCLDVAVVGTALVLLAPVMAAIALAVWATSGRPILYAQERMGLDGRVFRMLKFRTMAPDAERKTGPVWTREADPRRTRLGRFLRRTSLDELPQLWNVLRGEMSIVGPRPERPVFIEQFRHELPGYMLRHKVKAGMTGWAQVHGWRGDTSLQERLEHDIHYIQNWSMMLDLRILLLTLRHVLFGRNAY